METPRVLEGPGEETCAAVCRMIFVRFRDAFYICVRAEGEEEGMIDPSDTKHSFKHDRPGPCLAASSPTGNRLS